MGADLVDLRHGERFGHGGPREPVRAVIRDPRGLHFGDRGAHHFVVLVVHASGEAVPGDLGEAGKQSLRRDARKTLRVGIERRELEGARAGLDHVSDVLGAVLGRDRAIEREVDARLGAGLGGLLPNPVAVADEKTGVIRHVDDGGDAARGRGAGRPDEILLILLRARMDLRVDGAGQDIGAAEIVPVRRRGRRSGADALDEPVANGDPAVVDHAIGAHHTSRDDQIEIAHRIPQ